MVDARDVVRAQALEVAAGWSAPAAPPSWALTAAVLRTIADEPALLDLAGRYFPCSGAARPPPDAGFGPTFRACCEGRRPRPRAGSVIL